MSSSKASAKRRAKGAESLRSEKKRRIEDDLEDDPDLSSDIKGIMMALQSIKEKTKKEEQQKSEETISSVTSDIRSMLEVVKTKIEKERQTFLKALSKSAKECESTLKNEYSKFQAAYERFSKDKAAHLQTAKDVFSKYEEEKEKLFHRYDQQRKKEKAALSEIEKTCADKIANAEETLKKKKQDNKNFSFLRKSLGSIFEGSDDDFDHDD
ncbi:uncharacterized protein A4U43_C04F3680 [Asparagus officinalis]|uniref:Meiosis-specific protein ASY3-like coiled-coil domain-containing protein n=1 Tax=Asparagus officinalis TaxID=4686 RepID=A0A5P1F2H7_ASPOF|nr:early endosome antigen 1 [Asparagus officinalis]ONK70999.1 uncharacterized protein A4U43_C04F3680 [Asparagus officinalis]